MPYQKQLHVSFESRLFKSWQCLFFQPISWQWDVAFYIKVRHQLFSLPFYSWEVWSIMTYYGRHTPIKTVVMSLGDNGQLSIINLRHRQNLTLVKSVCKTVPKSLFWAPTGVHVPRIEYVSWLLKKPRSICQSRWMEIQNTLLVICWAHWELRARISTLLCRCY